MNFNFYNDSLFRRLVGRFTTLTLLAYRTLVVIPCISLFVFLALMAYQSGGVGNIITGYMRISGYHSDTNTYKVCLDEQEMPETPSDKPMKEWGKDMAHQTPLPVKQIDPICQKYGEVSEDKKASMLTGLITRIYTTLVFLYLSVW